MKTSKLDELIAQKAYELDDLRALGTIMKSGDCNSCKKYKCEYKPSPGQMVRYNCPHYVGNGNVGE